MALPVIKKLEYETTLPLSKQVVTFRPYTVGDEKLLLSAAAARESDPQFYLNNTLKVISSCLGSKGELVNVLPAVDVEFLLLQIRAKSVGEMIEIRYRDEEEGRVFNLEINLEKFTVKVPENHQYKIEITDEIGFVMRDLPFKEKITYATRFTDKTKSDIVYETILDCIVSIYDADTVYVVGTDTTKEEAREFLNSLQNMSKRLYEFISTMPQLQIEVTLPDGRQKTFTGGEVDFLALSPAT